MKERRLQLVIERGHGGVYEIREVPTARTSDGQLMLARRGRQEELSQIFRILFPNNAVMDATILSFIETYGTFVTDKSYTTTQLLKHGFVEVPARTAK